MDNLTTYKWSLDQWHKLIETGVLADKRVELLEGEIIKVSPEGIEHRKVNDSAADYLRELLKGKAKIYEAHPISLDNSEPEPDIAIVKLPVSLYDNHHPYSQDIYWLVEVSQTTLQVDLGEKAVIYARNNIPEYWVIDLVNHRLIVHTQPIGDRYTQIIEYLAGTIKPLAFPNIAIDIHKLLADG